MRNIPKCECGNNCFETVPTEFTLPSIFGIEIRIANWGRMQYSDECIECYMDKHNSKFDDIYEAGVRDGYCKAIENGDRR